MAKVPGQLSLKQRMRTLLKNWQSVKQLSERLGSGTSVIGTYLHKMLETRPAEEGYSWLEYRIKPAPTPSGGMESGQ